MDAVASPTDATCHEIGGAMWVSNDPDFVPGPGSGIWDSEPNSVRGSFRADDVEVSALCCSLSVSEDGMSEYSESHSHYGSDSSKKSGRGGSAGASPLTSESDRSSSMRGNRSLPSPAYLSSGVGSSVVATGSSASATGSEPSAVGATTPPDDGIRSGLENGSVSPKRRSHGRGASKRHVQPTQGAASGRGETLRTGWLGRPGAQPPPRGQVFQSCLRPGVGSVRTIIEEEGEGYDSEEEEGGDHDFSTRERGSQKGSKRHHGANGLPSLKLEEKVGQDQGECQQSKQHFFLRSTSDQSKTGASAGPGSELGARQKTMSEKDSQKDRMTLSQGRPPAHEGSGCLCPAAADTPTESSSATDSPSGSPRGEKLSTMSVYFCGLPGTGYGKKRRTCGLCGGQVGRRAPHCPQCRLVVYCDRRCLERHEASHARSCPGASAKRLREAASALTITENNSSEGRGQAELLGSPEPQAVLEHSEADKMAEPSVCKGNQDNLSPEQPLQEPDAHSAG